MIETNESVTLLHICDCENLYVMCMLRSSLVLVGSITMWGTFVLATSNMAASAIALAASSPMAPLFDRSSSTTLDENNVVSL